MSNRSIKYFLLALFLAFLFGCSPTETIKKDEPGDTPTDKTGECKKHYNIGFEYKKMKMYEDARINFEKAVECSSKYVDAYLGLAEVYTDMQQYGLSEETYKTLIENVEGTVKGWTGLGSLYAKLGRYDEALEAYNKAMAIDSSDATIFHGKGYVYEKMKDFENAQQLYEKAYNLSPDSRAITFALGKVYLEREKCDKAVTLLDKLAVEFPNDIEVRLILGDAHFDCKNYAKALENYLSIESDLSEFGTIYLKIALTYEGLREYSNASNYYLTAIEKSDNKRAPYIRLINMYLTKAKNYGKAQKYITEAFAISPNDPALNCMNGDVYIGYGDGARSGKKYKTAIAHYQTAKNWYSKALGDSKWGSYASGGIKRADAKIKNTQNLLWYGDD
jgi:tetratricopeptide (TPR) repeat protein